MFKLLIFSSLHNLPEKGLIPFLGEIYAFVGVSENDLGMWCVYIVPLFVFIIWQNESEITNLYLGL